MAEINGDGLVIDTLDELIARYATGFKTIYDLTDSELPVNSPDRQMIDIMAQNSLDLQELIEMINNQFFVNKAQGIYLNQTGLFSGIFRQPATRSEVLVVITSNRAGIVLNSGFQVKDATGNLFNLISAATLSVGDNSLAFEADAFGAIQVLPNTITSAVTIIIGITNINNPAGQYILGANEETDDQLRVRLYQNSATPGQNLVDSMIAQLNNLPGVITANVYENDTSITDSNGIPPNSIWAIADGGDQNSIGRIIYINKTGGTGTYGSIAITGNLGKLYSRNYTVNFSRPSLIYPTVSFNVQFKSGVPGLPDISFIKNEMVQNLIFKVGQPMTATDIDEFVSLIYQGKTYCYSIVIALPPAAPVNQIVPAINQRIILQLANITINGV